MMTWPQFEKKIDRWVRDFPDAVENALETGGEIILGEAQRKHLSGPKMPKGVGNPMRGTLQPRSGDLKTRLNKRVRVSRTDVSLRVGSNMVYAATHEYGDPRRGIPARPFLRSSRDARIDDVKAIILKRIMAAYERA